MRGIGCLLTGVELFPGNVQGGSDTPAGWAKGHLDRSGNQEPPADQAGHAHPLRLARIRRHGARPRRHLDAHGLRRRQQADRADRRSLPDVQQALWPDERSGEPDEHPRRPAGRSEQGRARRSARRTASCWTSMRRSCARWSRSSRQSAKEAVGHAVPPLEPGVKHDNDNMPKISQDADRPDGQQLRRRLSPASRRLQFTNSVGDARMHWLGVSEGHHELSHEPDSDTKAQEKLTKINKWYLRADWPTWPSGWPKPPNRAAAAACSTTR